MANYLQEIKASSSWQSDESSRSNLNWGDPLQDLIHDDFARGSGHLFGREPGSVKNPRVCHAMKADHQFHEGLQITERRVAMAKAKFIPPISTGSSIATIAFIL